MSGGNGTGRGSKRHVVEEKGQGPARVVDSDCRGRKYTELMSTGTGFQTPAPIILCTRHIHAIRITLLACGIVALAGMAHSLHCLPFCHGLYWLEKADLVTQKAIFR